MFSFGFLFCSPPETVMPQAVQPGNSFCASPRTVGRARWPELSASGVGLSGDSVRQLLTATAPLINPWFSGM